MEREARGERRALQATQEQGEQQDQHEKEQADHEEQQSKSGESSPSIKTASLEYVYRVLPRSSAARTRLGV